MTLKDVWKTCLATAERDLAIVDSQITEIEECTEGLRANDKPNFGELLAREMYYHKLQGLLSTKNAMEEYIGTIKMEIERYATIDQS